MPSVSKAQQKFMGIVHAYKKGEIPASKVSKAVKDAAKSMKKKSTKKMASTKHKGLPNKVRSENMNEDGHTDVASAKRAMKLIAEDAADMFKKLKSMDDEASLPSWWMNKIAVCKTYMNTSRDYLDKPNENITEYDEQALGQPLKFSNTEAEKFAKMDVQKMGKAINKASYQAIKMMMGGVKAGKYDAMDLIRAIKTGSARDASMGVRDFLQVLWNKSRDGFRRYSKNKRKLR